MCTKNNILLFITITVSIMVSLASCTDDREYKVPKIAGYYRVESLQANADVDLNNDGIVSANFKDEISLADYISPYNFTTPDSFIEIRPTKYNDTNLQTIYIPFPHPNLRFEYSNSPKGAVIYTRNYINGIGYNYVYDSKQNVIHINRTNIKDEDEELWGKLTAMEAIENNKLQVIISKNYYDFATASWVRLTLTGIYTKVEN